MSVVKLKPKELLWPIKKDGHRPKTLTPGCIQGTAFSFLSNAIRVKNQFKENPKKSKTAKEATKENKHDVTDGHENEAQSP